MVLVRSLILLAIVVSGLFPIAANARSRIASGSDIAPTQIVGVMPTLAPFQHVRFCLRYPADCKADEDQGKPINLDAGVTELLKQVNRSVNLSIVPQSKSYGSNLEDGWTIGPDHGDCNDYAVTKRHKLIESGLPSSALRLSVVRTASGVGHLLLIVTTTKGDLVMDNLTDAIRPWQVTNYQWLKIQSDSNPRFWNEIRPSGMSQALVGRKIDIAGR